MIISSLYAWVGNMIAVALPSSFSPLIISLTGALWGPGDMATNALLQKEFSEKQRATIASINSFAANALFAVFMLVAGWLADRYGPIKALLIVQVLIFPTILLRWYIPPVLHIGLTAAQSILKIKTNYG